MGLPANWLTHLDELADVDVDTVPPSNGQTLLYSGGVWSPGAPGSFDPDVPLGYFTMADTATGDTAVVTVESGSLVVEVPLTTEAGAVLTTEAGVPLTVES